MRKPKPPKRTAAKGGTFYGIGIGILMGLVVAAAVAFYITRAPVPFLDRTAKRFALQHRAADRRHKLDPNQGLYALEGSRIAPRGAALGASRSNGSAGSVAKESISSGSTGATFKGSISRGAAIAKAPMLGAIPKGSTLSRAESDRLMSTLHQASLAEWDRVRTARPPPASGSSPVSLPRNDALESLIASLPKSAAHAASSVRTKTIDKSLVKGNPSTSRKEDAPGKYFLQVGTYRGTQETEALRARILLLGLPVIVSRTAIHGKFFNRVRVGPFSRLEEMNRARRRLGESKIKVAVVRQ